VGAERCIRDKAEPPKKNAKQLYSSSRSDTDSGFHIAIYALSDGAFEMQIRLTPEGRMDAAMSALEKRMEGVTILPYRDELFIHVPLGTEEDGIERIQQNISDTVLILNKDFLEQTFEGAAAAITAMQNSISKHLGDMIFSRIKKPQRAVLLTYESSQAVRFILEETQNGTIGLLVEPERLDDLSAYERARYIHKHLQHSPITAGDEETIIPVYIRHGNETQGAGNSSIFIPLAQSPKRTEEIETIHERLNTALSAFTDINMVKANKIPLFMEEAKTRLFARMDENTRNRGEEGPQP